MEGELAATTSACRRQNASHEQKTVGNVVHEQATTEKNDSTLHGNAFTQHCDYFDLSSTGIIWPFDTFQICRAWQWSFPTSLFFAGAIHFVQSYGTTPGVTPDPFWRIWKKNLRRNKHGSSTMSFEGNGSLDGERLHAFFEMNDRDKKGGITIWELWRGLKRQALPLDLFGQVSNFFEWFFAYLLVWPKDGVLREKDARAVCTGDMFRSRPEGDAEHPRPRPSNSPLFKKQVLSLVIVDMMVLPAIVAGMCYFVLRAIDDAVGLWKYSRRREKQMPQKSWRGYSDLRGESEHAGPTAAGVAGLLIVVGFVKVIWLR